MIDLHSHILPGLDDGAEDLATSLAMARAWVADGVTVVACTPHITPGVYANTGPQIRQAVAQLQLDLDDAGIPIKLVTGADNHIMPDMVAGLAAGRLLTLADTRYVLVEPTHHVAPLRLEDLFFSLLVAGYVPILTHPERLSWIQGQYATIQRLVQAGVWMQVTAGSLTGAFGSSPRYWAERMLDDGCVHILATDAHNMKRRPPNLAEGQSIAAKRLGADEAERLVVARPRAILEDLDPADVSMPASCGHAGVSKNDGAWGHDGQVEHTRTGTGHGMAGGGIGARLSDRVRRLLGH